MASRESCDSEREELHLSASSSSFESESGTEDEEEHHLPEEAVDGVAPYQFEPIVEDAENAEAAAAVPPEEGEDWRLNNSEWCACEECIPMPTVRESLCCREIPEVENRREEVVDIGCITHHEGFQPVCLNVHVLLVAYLQFRQQYGEREGHAINDRQYRYTAYRQFVRWCWGYLGKHVRVVLPSCAVRRIREAFPAAEYAGFQYPNLN
ncbi:P2X purinoceptor 7 [Holothuria leucospilota]|uniref:P2X purinoceptor 7 n=1 Tax=Holothuria leucospilota TaxID=206669 RepID=A0A9Q0Y9Y4_HOLLE|nr:P2X purinoceptor 7 [Holothuria leucospilota]